MGGGDGHLVVVEDHEHAAFEVTGVVQRLERHAGGHGTVTDDGNGVAGIATKFSGHSETKGSGDRGGGMGGTEGIIGAFRAFGEAAEAALGAQGADAVAAAGEDFVGIALMADVPDDLVARGIEDGVQGDGEFNDAKTGAKVAAGHRDGRDGFGAEFIGQLAQVAVGQGFEI